MRNQICVVIKGPTLKEASEQMQEALSEANLVEMRLDLFEEYSLEKLKKLISSYSLPTILTLRDKTQGGNYQGTETSRLEQILILASCKPAYIDLESHIPNSFFLQLKQKYPELKTIISYHHFTNTPENLDSILQQMSKKKADLYKIAVTSSQSLHTMRLLEWLEKQKTKLIAISMGEQGKMSRILGPIMGNSISYACLNANQSTAPGQMTAKELKDKYDFLSINPKTEIYGLIGDPVEQSIGDVTHNKIFQSFALNAVYVKIQVKKEELKEFLDLARKLPFKGLSVLMPLKEEVMKYLDFIDPKAKSIGAVNTLHFSQGTIKGYNTDCIGALNALEAHEPVKNKHLLIIGAGGSAKAIAHEACQRGAKVTIVNRDIHKAQNLAESLNCSFAGLDQMQECYRNGYHILINCTPVTQPIDTKYVLPNTTIMDIKTKAIDTPFIDACKNRQCSIVYGYRMFVEQALGQFDIWFASHFNEDKGRIILEATMQDLLLTGYSTSK